MNRIILILSFLIINNSMCFAQKKIIKNVDSFSFAQNGLNFSYEDICIDISTIADIDSIFFNIQIANNSKKTIGIDNHSSNMLNNTYGTDTLYVSYLLGSKPIDLGLVAQNRPILPNENSGYYFGTINTISKYKISIVIYHDLAETLFVLAGNGIKIDTFVSPLNYFLMFDNYDTINEGFLVITINGEISKNGIINSSKVIITTF